MTPRQIRGMRYRLQQSAGTALDNARVEALRSAPDAENFRILGDTISRLAGKLVAQSPQREAHEAAAKMSEARDAIAYFAGWLAVRDPMTEMRVRNWFETAISEAQAALKVWAVACRKLREEEAVSA